MKTKNCIRLPEYNFIYFPRFMWVPFQILTIVWFAPEFPGGGAIPAGKQHVV